jgi:Mce-associated membrane protein
MKEAHMTTQTTAPPVSVDPVGEDRTAEVPAPSSRLRRAWRLVDVALVALVLAALVAVGLVARATLADRADQSARAGALGAARQLATSFTTMDYRTYDRDAKRVVDGSAGQLRQQFTDSGAELKKAMTTHRSVTHGTVLDAAVVDADRDSARVLLVVDADVTNTSTTEPSARHYRIQLDLSRQHGRWLGTDLTFVG